MIHAAARARCAVRTRIDWDFVATHRPWTRVGGHHETVCLHVRERLCVNFSMVKTPACAGAPTPPLVDELADGRLSDECVVFQR